MTTFDETTETDLPGVTTTPDRVGDAAIAVQRAARTAAPVVVGAGKAAGAAVAGAATGTGKAAAGAARTAGGRLWLGLRTAPRAYRNWALASEKDLSVVLAMESKDATKLLLAERAQDSLVAHRAQAASRFLRVAVAVLCGGWFLATLAHIAVVAVAWILADTAKPDAKATVDPKSRQQAHARDALAAAVVSLALTAADAFLFGAGWGMVPVTIHPPGFTWGYQPVILVWPGLAVLAAAVWLIIAAKDGDVGNDLSDLAPAEPDMEVTNEGSILAALKASTIKLPNDADPAIVAPGATWHADNTVWMCAVDTRAGGRGPSAEPLTVDKDRADFASRLGLGAGRLFVTIDPDRGSRAHLIGVVGDPWGKPSRSPLMDAESWDLWNGVPFGQDITRRRVTVPAAFRNRLHGGQPDAGKSVSLYPIQAAFALSARSRFWVIDGGEVDTRPLYDAGLTHRWGTNQDEALDILTEIDREVELRQSRLAEFGQDHKGLGKKVSPQFFDYYKCGFDILLWDELATFTTSGDKTTAKEIMKVATSVFQRCRKVGIHVVLATQSPSSNAMDTDGRDVISDRFALTCKTPEMSDKILGRGHAKAGFDASTLLLTDRAGWLSDSDGDRIVRADYLTDDDMDLIYHRGKQLRGGIIHRPTEVNPYAVAVLELLRTHEVESMRTAEVVGRLIDASHQLPEGLAGQKVLAFEMKKLGIETSQVRADGNRAHYFLDDVAKGVREASNRP